MKRFLLLATITLSSFYGFSQGNFNSNFRGIFKADYGFRAGVNISNLDVEPVSVENNEHRNGFYFGGFIEFHLTNFLSLNTELQWSAEGAKRDDLRANYINLPIQLKLNLTDDLSIGVGPQASLKTWQEQDNFETFTFSVVGGVQYKVYKNFFIDARAVYGLTDILDDSVTSLEAKQFAIQVGVGIHL